MLRCLIWGLGALCGVQALYADSWCLILGPGALRRLAALGASFGVMALLKAKRAPGSLHIIMIPASYTDYSNALHGLFCGL